VIRRDDLVDHLLRCTHRLQILQPFIYRLCLAAVGPVLNGVG